MNARAPSHAVFRSVDVTIRLCIYLQTQHETCKRHKCKQQSVFVSILQRGGELSLLRLHAVLERPDLERRVDDLVRARDRDPDPVHAIEHGLQVVREPDRVLVRLARGVLPHHASFVRRALALLLLRLAHWCFCAPLERRARIQLNSRVSLERRAKQMISNVCGFNACVVDIRFMMIHINLCMSPNML